MDNNNIVVFTRYVESARNKLAGEELRKLFWIYSAQVGCCRQQASEQLITELLYFSTIPSCCNQTSASEVTSKQIPLRLLICIITNYKDNKTCLRQPFLLSAFPLWSVFHTGGCQRSSSISVLPANELFVRTYYRLCQDAAHQPLIHPGLEPYSYYLILLQKAQRCRTFAVAWTRPTFNKHFFKLKIFC